MIPYFGVHLHAKMSVGSLPKAIDPFNGDHTWSGRGMRCARSLMTVPGGNRALSPRRERTSPSDGEMPWPESLRGDDAERAKGTDVSGNNSARPG